MIGLVHVRSFEIQPAPRISLEPFDLESQHLTRTPAPTYSAATPDVTSVGRYRKKTVENTPSDGFRVEFLENDFSKDHEILLAYRGQSAPQMFRK